MADIWQRMAASTETERGPITRAEADKAYRTIRSAYLLVAAAGFLAITLFTVLLGAFEWKIWLGMAIFEGVTIPLGLYIYHRELNERVRDSALSPVIDDDRR